MKKLLLFEMFLKEDSTGHGLTVPRLFGDLALRNGFDFEHVHLGNFDENPQLVKSNMKQVLSFHQAAASELVLVAYTCPGNRISALLRLFQDFPEQRFWLNVSPDRVPFTEPSFVPRNVSLFTESPKVLEHLRDRGLEGNYLPPTNPIATENLRPKPLGRNVVSVTFFTQTFKARNPRLVCLLVISLRLFRVPCRVRLSQNPKNPARDRRFLRMMALFRVPVNKGVIEDFSSFLGESRINALLYSPQSKFEFSPSGVLMESTIQGIPVLCLERTWLAEKNFALGLGDYVVPTNFFLLLNKLIRASRLELTWLDRLRLARRANDEFSNTKFIENGSRFFFGHSD